MKTVIIDDDLLFAETLQVFLKEKLNIQADINQLDPIYDLYFLDIDMPDANGIDFAKSIDMTNNLHIIFISNYEDLVFDALKVSPLAFIRKKKFEEDMNYVIHLIKNLQPKNMNISDDIHIPVDSIMLIEKYNSYSHIYTLNHQYKLRISLRDLLKQLSDCFILINKGTIINAKWIDQINDNQVILKNKNIYYISRRRKTEVLVKYIKYKERL